MSSMQGGVCHHLQTAAVELKEQGEEDKCELMLMLNIDKLLLV